MTRTSVAFLRERHLNGARRSSAFGRPSQRSRGRTALTHTTKQTRPPRHLRTFVFPGVNDKTNKMTIIILCMCFFFFLQSLESVSIFFVIFDYGRPFIR